MKNIEDLKQLQASVQSTDKVEELREAFANVSQFAEVIAKHSEEQALARKTAEATATEIQSQLAELTTKYNEVIAAQAALAAEQAYQTRMATVEEVFAFDDETRAELLEEIKACGDEESFAKWLARAKKLFKSQTRESIALIQAKETKEEKKQEDDMGDKGGEKKKTDDECDAATKAVLASASSNGIDPTVTNIINTNTNKSLDEQYKEVFASSIRIGGVTVKELQERAKNNVSLTH